MKRRSILNAIFIVSILCITAILIQLELSKIKLSQSATVSYGLDVEYEARLNWPDQRLFTLDLGHEHFEPYIYLELSNNDTYAIEFVNTLKEHSHTLVINSYDWAWYYFDVEFKPIMHLIPSYISEDGYDQINIKIIDGDAQYAVRNIQLRDSSALDFIDHYANTIDFEIKQIEIFIDEQDYQKIEDKREEALLLNILISEDGDEVNATFISEGETSNGSLRLKGDWTDHLASDKWSFRIDLDSDDSIYGMSEFSVQDPATRLGVKESVLYQFYQSQGGVALRYDFVDIFVNGIYKGVYASEEFFTSDMIEASEKRDGPIIKANEDVLWASRAYDFSNVIFDGNIETFKYSTSIKTEDRIELSEYAINLYQSYLNGHLSLSQTFDIELLAKYHAIEDIFIAEHGSRVWHNIRYYLNPITLKLEPIPYDELSNEYGNVEMSFGFPELDSDPIYFSLYIKYLREYSSSVHAFVSDNKAWIDEMMIMLYRDGSYVGDLEFLPMRTDFIMTYLNENSLGTQ